jgi:hypothetical protein
MPNDAKLGLVLGVGLVITLAVLFFHRDGTTADAGDVSAAQQNSVGKPAGKPQGKQQRAPRAKPSSLPKENEESVTPVETSATDQSESSILNAIQPAGGSPIELQPVPE